MTIKNVSEIQIIPIRPVDGLVALASLTYNNSLHLESIGIYTRPRGGYRLSYPTRKVGNASISIFYPINKAAATEIEDAVISHYQSLISHSVVE